MYIYIYISLGFWKSLPQVVLAPLEMAFSYSPTISSLTWAPWKNPPIFHGTTMENSLDVDWVILDSYVDLLEICIYIYIYDMYV